MDFASLPPEVNSARMYSGPGSGPLLAAASAWDGIAADLLAGELGYQTVLNELATSWTGPTATAMTTAAAPYLAWLHATAGQAEHTANQARAAAAAYETAFTVTVPPPVVTANRSQWAGLVATNLLGQNTLAIALADADYAQMWAQDVTAMYGYAAGAAAAAQLTPFTEPPQTTNPAGGAQQAGAAGAAAATAAGNHTQTVASAVTQTLQGLTSPVTGTAGSGSSALAALAPALAADPGVAVALAALASSLFGTFVIDSAGTFGIDVAGTFGIDLIGVGEIGSELLPFGPLAGSTTPVTAGLGGAGSVGRLSVPPTWTSSAPSMIRQISTVVPEAVPAVAASETAIPFAEMAAAGMAGRATAGIGRGRRAAGAATRKPPAPQPAGQPGYPEQPEQPGQPERPARPANGPITKISGELRELADLHRCGVLTDQEFAEEKRRLLGR